MSKNEQDVLNLLADRKAMLQKGGQTGIVLYFLLTIVLDGLLVKEQDGKPEKWNEGFRKNCIPL